MKSPRMSARLADRPRERAGASHEFTARTSSRASADRRTLAGPEAGTKGNWPVFAGAVETAHTQMFFTFEGLGAQTWSHIRSSDGSL